MQRAPWQRCRHQRTDSRRIATSSTFLLISRSTLAQEESSSRLRCKRCSRSFRRSRDLSASSCFVRHCRSRAGDRRCVRRRRGGPAAARFSAATARMRCVTLSRYSGSAHLARTEAAILARFASFFACTPLLYHMSECERAEVCGLQLRARTCRLAAGETHLQLLRAHRWWLLSL